MKSIDRFVVTCTFARKTLATRRARVATALTIATAALTPAANAQNPIIENSGGGNGGIYYYVGAAVINANISGYDIVIGKAPGGQFANAGGDTDLGNTDVTKYTLTVKSGAIISYNYQDDGYEGLSVFNRNTLAILGGQVSDARGYNASVIDIAGGNVGGAAAFNTSSLHITGGTVGETTIPLGGVAGYDNSAVDISGGYVNSAEGHGTSVTNVNGGLLYMTYGYDHSDINITGGTVGGDRHNSSWRST